MSYKPAIQVKNLHKCYQLYSKPQDRLKQFLWRGRRTYFREFWALRNINFEVKPGEVIGIIGRNGSGKSTLLQLICGTLTPSSGEVTVNGRVAALLELGAGFNPEFSGRENVWMSATIAGLSRQEIAKRFDSIVEFSGIADFIDQPAKTYSSGMYMRLAFSVAINVDPDILVIDEALSVGDGAFARQSFNRIMQLRDEGKTILFCSHSMYQVEAICNRVIWLNQGTIQTMGSAAHSVVAYNTFLSTGATSTDDAPSDQQNLAVTPNAAELKNISVSCDNKAGKELRVFSRKSTVEITVEFTASIDIPTPTIAITIDNANGDHIASAGTINDKINLELSKERTGQAIIQFPNFALLKGIYWVNVFLLCEQGVHLYQDAKHVARLSVEQSDLEVGVVSLPHLWHGLSIPSKTQPN